MNETMNEKSVSKPQQQASKSWLIENEKEAILIYGGAKVGKTWAYCSIIQHAIDNGNKVYILNTDGGVTKTFKQYFGEDAEKYAKNTEYHFIPDMTTIMELMPKLLSKVTLNDWVIIDLISDIWDLAQHKFLADLTGGKVSDYVIIASNDSKKFGMFEGKMWVYVRSFYDFVMKPLTSRISCNVVGVASQKDIDVLNRFMFNKPDDLKALTTQEFIKIGFKPAGIPRIEYDFNTVVYVGQDTSTQKRFLYVVGDRGAETPDKKVVFGTNFYEILRKIRTKKY